MSRRSVHASTQPVIRHRAVQVIAGSFLAVLLIVVGPASADTIDPQDNDSQYAWSETAGWLNAEPLGNSGPGARIWETRAEGWIWAENIGWISLSCTNTASCSTVNYGVTNDGAGELGGFAWSENAGWVSFACENTMSCAFIDYGVVVDPATGELSGFAWAENLGWISFSCVNTGSCTTVDYRVTTEVPFFDDGIFADGFESGDTSAWSGVAP